MGCSFSWAASSIAPPVCLCCSLTGAASYTTLPVCLGCSLTWLASSTVLHVCMCCSLICSLIWGASSNPRLVCLGCSLISPSCEATSVSFHVSPVCSFTFLVWMGILGCSSSCWLGSSSLQKFSSLAFFLNLFLYHLYVTIELQFYLHNFTDKKKKVMSMHLLINQQRVLDCSLLFQCG
jgi:hypothetical protein